MLIICRTSWTLHRAQVFVEGIDAETFIADRRTNYAVVRALNIISQSELNMKVLAHFTPLRMSLE